MAVYILDTFSEINGYGDFACDISRTGKYFELKANRDGTLEELLRQEPDC